MYAMYRCQFFLRVVAVITLGAFVPTAAQAWNFLPTPEPPPVVRQARIPSPTMLSLLSLEAMAGFSTAVTDEPDVISLPVLPEPRMLLASLSTKPDRAPALQDLLDGGGVTGSAGAPGARAGSAVTPTQPPMLTAQAGDPPDWPDAPDPAALLAGADAAVGSGAYDEAVDLYFQVLVW